MTNSKNFSLGPDVPFGYDEGGGTLSIGVFRQGGLRYIPWEELSRFPPQPYFVADTIEEFIKAGLDLAKETS